MQGEATYSHGQLITCQMSCWYVNECNDMASSVIPAVTLLLFGLICIGPMVKMQESGVRWTTSNVCLPKPPLHGEEHRLCSGASASDFGLDAPVQLSPCHHSAPSPPARGRLRIVFCRRSSGHVRSRHCTTATWYTMLQRCPIWSRWRRRNVLRRDYNLLTIYGRTSLLSSCLLLYQPLGAIACSCSDGFCQIEISNGDRAQGEATGHEARRGLRRCGS